jgi:hypothetical protein
MPDRVKHMSFFHMNECLIRPADFTCNFCEYKKCKWAYDTYNTNGDCLACK